MQTYSFSQWILFFFIYSFAGWIWESCYVSVRERRWVNRGFMHGPFLPLYGSGAVTVLACTLAVRDNIVLVYFIGMTGATTLEFITGAVMEKLFRVKYWDYSKHRFNLKGYICLMSSLCWGCFSVLMVKAGHPPVERAVLMLPKGAAAAAACILAAGTAVDFAMSFREAMDMKELLGRLEQTKEQLLRLQDKLKQVPENAAEDYRQRTEKWKQDLAEIKDSIMREVQKLTGRSDKRYLHIAGLLRRNPGAVSEKFKETFEELKKLINGRK